MARIEANAGRDGSRVLAHGVLALVASTAAAVFAPYALAIFGPLVFGIPHVLGDVRYLVVRPRLARRRAACAVVVLASFASLAVGARASVVGALLLSAFALTGLEGAGPRAMRLRALTVALAALACAVPAFVAPRLADAVFAHLHHLISCSIFFTFAARARAASAWLLAAIVAAVAWVASGVCDPWLHVAFASTELPIDPARIVRSIALGLEGAPALRWVATFLLLQSFHYAIWLRLVPEVSNLAARPRGALASLRALVTDLGGVPVVLAVVAMIGLGVYAAEALHDARNRYLYYASFHGHLELLAALALALAPPSFDGAERDTLPP